MLYFLVKSFCRTVFKNIYRVEIRGLDNIPVDGPLIICANHINWLDSPLVGSMLTRRRMYVMAKEELFRLKVLSSFLKEMGAFPVRRGSADIRSIRTSLALLKNKEFIAMFPEGTRSKTGKMGEASPGVALIALKGRSPVLPVAIRGDYRFFGKVKINIGKPLDFSKYYGEKAKKGLLLEITTDIMDEIKKLYFQSEKVI